MGKDRSIFQTDKRIRLGVWGLGRGLSFYRACSRLNLDVVAGCDYNPHMREHFCQLNPDAMVTDDADAFLSADFDAVLLATFCPDHAGDAIRCIEAGKHVLSEVTAFHTPAEGVRLVEAVEKSGLVYNLAENYPFTAAQMYVARRWREGLFGELMYAEGEYVHGVPELCYTYIDGVPIEPGFALHNWRSWLSFHYYCTHSLGPVMHATGTRPTRVVALPGTVRLPGFPPTGTPALGHIAPSLITMNNGAVVRNLMGGTTNDTHVFRYWGTRGSAEIAGGVTLRLGGLGRSPKLPVTPSRGDAPEMDALAEAMGHGGGDLYVLYYFARQILFGTPAPWDIHPAADVTLPGILAYRSSLEGGRPYDVPDFRRKAERDEWRHDDGAQPRYAKVSNCFPKSADKRLTGRFNSILKNLIPLAANYRAFADWSKVYEDVQEPERVLEIASHAIDDYPAFREALQDARALADAYPRSDGARILREWLEFAEEETVMAPDFLDQVRRFTAALHTARPGTGE